MYLSCIPRKHDRKEASRRHNCRKNFNRELLRSRYFCIVFFVIHFLWISNTKKDERGPGLECRQAVACKHSSAYHGHCATISLPVKAWGGGVRGRGGVFFKPFLHYVRDSSVTFYELLLSSSFSTYFDGFLLLHCTVPRLYVPSYLILRSSLLSLY
jgi:hypothetical protein